MTAEKSTIEEFLDENGTVVYNIRGVSMLPLLRQAKDLVIVQRRDNAGYGVGDVVLYRRRSGQIVLHRIIGIQPDGYVLRGDNCVRREYGVRDKDIMGKMTGYVRGGRVHRVEDASYRVYTSVWLRTGFFRVGLKRLCSAGKALVRKEWPTVLDEMPSAEVWKQ